MCRDWVPHFSLIAYAMRPGGGRDRRSGAIVTPQSRVTLPGGYVLDDWERVSSRV